MAFVVSQPEIWIVMPSKLRKIVADFDAIGQMLVDLFVDRHPEPLEVVLDLDRTDIN